MDEFGRRAYKTSIALAIAHPLLMIVWLLCVWAGALPQTLWIGLVVSAILGTAAIGAILLGIASMIVRFRVGAAVSVAVAGLELANSLASIHALMDLMTS